MLFRNSRKEELVARLGEPLKYLQMPPKIVEQIIIATLRDDQRHAASKVDVGSSRLEARFTAVRNCINAAYVEKLDGKIPEEF
jgi:hypothetical protein